MKRFGFGCMRLPLLNTADPSSIDHKTFSLLVDEFLDRGFSYFDTAYNYCNYHSEEALRDSLVKRYPREHFTITTKMPMRDDVLSVKDMEAVFAAQLKNCGVDYFDKYLVHNIGPASWAKACALDTFGFLRAQKAAGFIEHLGFSFHGAPELLEEVLATHPDVDFVQLQLNYIDWDNPGIQSRACYEIARAHHKPIIVMEPCKGGDLAVVAPEAAQLMHDYNPSAEPASWALRYVAALEGVIMVLSGMNSREQVVQNTTTMSNPKPLNAEEMRILSEVKQIIERDTAVPCTACGYCVHGCPQHIPLPDYFALYNSIMRSHIGDTNSQRFFYMNLSAGRSKASDCIACGQCSDACPQHLDVVKLLEEASSELDRPFVLPKKQ